MKVESFYLKIKFIISIIAILLLISILIIFIVNKNRNVYITNVENIDNIKLSMIKIEDGISTVIKEVPASGNWSMNYNCENDKTKLYWDDDNRKILIKEISNTECTVRFEKTKSAINVVSMYIDDVYVGELDENKSYKLISYECSNGETVEWNGIEGNATINSLKKSTHCKLYFEEAPYIYNKILLDNVAQSDSGINFANPSSDTNGKGLYYTADNQYGEDNERIYYFRGRVENNWVSFGGFLWRIVRTTSEKGVKLVYSGDGNTASSGFINTSKFSSSYAPKYYLGYTQNMNEYLGVQTNSIIKTTIDNWYNSNISQFVNYLSPTAIYCNARTERIYGSAVLYPARDNLYTNKRPTYLCSYQNASRYTVDLSTGNGYLTNPIASLSADETYFAGLVFYPTCSLDSYIMDNSISTDWWNISPFSDSGDSHITNVNGTGCIIWSRPDYTYGIRPVIALKSCVTINVGNGTKDNPYVVSDVAC